MFGGLTIAACGTAVLVLAHLMTDELRRETGRALDAVAQRAAATLADGLTQRLLEARVLAGSSALWADGLDSPAVRQALERAHAAQPHSAWIGVANLDGKVVAATAGVLVGQSVAQRPWFAAGQHDPHVGDVHGAVLLERLLGPAPHGEPLRFVDFSAPIVSGGRTLGVLGMHGTWNWAREVVSASLPADAGRAGLEVYIFDRNGKLLYSPRTSDGDGTALSSAMPGLPTAGTDLRDGSAGVVRWPDGLDSLTTMAALPSSSPVTDLGWRIVARQPVERAFARARTASELALGVGIGFALLSGWLAWLAAGVFSRPLATLADAARGVQRRLRRARIPVLTQHQELRALSGALASMTRCLRATHQAAPIGLCQLDLTGHVLEANLRLGQLLGVAAEQLPGRRLADFLAPRHRAELDAALSRLAPGTAANATLEASLERAGSEPLPVVVSASRVSDIEGQDDYYIVVVEDVSLRIAVEVADRASEAKNSFLSQVSHELRTPLNAVLGFSQLMRMDGAEPLSSTQQGRVAAIEDAGRHLLAMIDDLLDLTRFEARPMALVREPVRLSDAIDQAITLLGDAARTVDVTIVRQPPTGGRGGDTVLGDPVRLRQVALNLISNAVKYNRPGGTVAVSWGRSAGGGQVEWHVIDTGVGIAPGDLDALFQPFNRLGAQGSNIQGTGIGLVITRKLVDMMGGEIRVSSSPGVGSCFTVMLPSSDLPPAAPPREGSPSLTGIAPLGAPGPVRAPLRNGRRARLLYVEDNPVNVQLLVGAIATRPDLELIVATSGREALARAAQARPDVFLLDMQLGDMTGFELGAALRRLPGCSDVPLLAVSADAMPSRLAEARARGFHAYLTKPFHLQALFAGLDAALGTVPAD